MILTTTMRKERIVELENVMTLTKKIIEEAVVIKMKKKMKIRDVDTEMKRMQMSRVKRKADTILTVRSPVDLLEKESDQYLRNVVEGDVIVKRFVLFLFCGNSYLFFV